MIRIDVASRLIAAAIVVTLAAASVPRDAMAQDSPTRGPQPAGAVTAACTDPVKLSKKPAAKPVADTATRVSWVSRRDAVAAGIAIAVTLAVSPLDRPVSKEFRESGWQRNANMHRASDYLAFAGGPGPFVLGAGMFAVGEATRSPGLSSTGVHLTESVLLAAAVTALGKGIAGRALPGVQTKEQFEWDRGFHRGNGPFVSFPSGHTAAAFAMASALTGESAYWHPGMQRYVGPAAYLVATGVGIARLYQNVHWVSDLPLAAAIGTWAGIAVESHVHAHGRQKVLGRIVACASIGRSEHGQTTVSCSLPLTIPSGKF